MSAFNTINAVVTCPVCGNDSEFGVQFKYGNTRQISYHVGEQIRWGGNDIGVPQAKKVRVDGVGGPCPNCGADYLDLDVLIEDNVITRVDGLGTREKESDLGYEILDD